MERDKLIIKIREIIENQEIPYYKVAKECGCDVDDISSICNETKVDIQDGFLYQIYNKLFDFADYQ